MVAGPGLSAGTGRKSTLAKWQDAAHTASGNLHPGAAACNSWELFCREQKKSWNDLICYYFSHLSLCGTQHHLQHSGGVCLQLWRRKLSAHFREPANCLFPYGDGLYGLFWTGWGDAKLEEMLLSTSNLLRLFSCSTSPRTTRKALCLADQPKCVVHSQVHMAAKPRKRNSPPLTVQAKRLNYKEVGVFSPVGNVLKNWRFWKKITINTWGKKIWSVFYKNFPRQKFQIDLKIKFEKIFLRFPFVSLKQYREGSSEQYKAGSGYLSIMRQDQTYRSHSGNMFLKLSIGNSAISLSSL